MMTCGVCGQLKANSQLYRLGETEVPICKACQGRSLSPDREFEAMRIAAVALEPLDRDARARTLAYLRMRFHPEGV